MTDNTLGAYTRHEKHDADDFAHAHFAMHPVTGSVASKGRMDWKWVLPGWCNTGAVSRLSDQQMADAGWSPVRECPDPEQHGPIDYKVLLEQAERERDEARRERGEALDRLCEASRPLTPDAITDAMVERGRCAYCGNDCTVEERVRAVLTAALTEPPARSPEAEELEADISRDGEDAPFDLTPEHVTVLAHHLAGLGWTKEKS